MPVELKCESGRGKRYCRALKADALELLGAHGAEGCELSLVIVSDCAIRALNREFRNQAAATDVLSFPQMEAGEVRRKLGGEVRRTSPPSLDGGAAGRRGGAADAKRPPLPLGDVVISVDTAQRQARALGVAAAQRLRTLLIHGFLHLLGYDHEGSEAQARRMFARERELAARLRLLDEARLSGDVRMRAAGIGSVHGAAAAAGERGSPVAMEAGWERRAHACARLSQPGGQGRRGGARR